MSERVAGVGDVPEGTMIRVAFEGTHIGIANVDGVFYAIDDACSHMGCPLSDGQMDEGTVVCGCHGSRFDLTNGEVVQGPARKPVASFPVEVSGDDLLMEAPASG
jgi:3-phenylpropionate/trans-cinnamate dioxygenase ferredoxin component